MGWFIFSDYAQSHNKIRDNVLIKKLWDKGCTPINVAVLLKYLKIYEQKLDSKFLEDGFQNGFRLQYTGPRNATDSNNLVSALTHKSETLEKLQAEVNLGRMLGPFNEKPILTLRVSPIGL